MFRDLVRVPNVPAIEMGFGVYNVWMQRKDVKPNVTDEATSETFVEPSRDELLTLKRYFKLAEAAYEGISLISSSFSSDMLSGKCLS